MAVRNVGVRKAEWRKWNRRVNEEAAIWGRTTRSGRNGGRLYVEPHMRTDTMSERSIVSCKRLRMRL
jgi:hypothetical protein